MNRRTKFVIGVSLVVSAVTTLISFLVLCFKKKNVWEVIVALAAAEGLVGFALIENKSPIKFEIKKKTADEVEEIEAEQEPQESEGSVDEVAVEETEDTPLSEQPSTEE